MSDARKEEALLRRQVQLTAQPEAEQEARAERELTAALGAPVQKSMSQEEVAAVLRTSLKTRG